MELIELVTTYGPLGLGWPFFLYMLKQNGEMQKEIRTAFMAHTAAQVELNNTIEKLIEVVKK